MKTIKWKIHLNSNPEVVYNFLNTTIGREKFWAEKAREENGFIYFTFPNGVNYESKIIHTQVNREFNIDYFNSDLKISLEPSKDDGTDLTLINKDILDEEFLDIHAGWVSVLMNLKAAVDHNCDLRNHDKNRTWSQGYVDN